ncbi:MAG: replicative DNA helicase [Clostridia bacterium]|nr:replicative DNA helicase [Clostridia bacterium]
MAEKNRKENTVVNSVNRGRVLPSNIEAEQSLLACMMINSDLALEIIGSLTEQDFYTKSHQLIIGAMRGVARLNSPIELVTVKDQLEREDKLAQAGGFDYLVDLNTMLPSSANYKVYMQIVRRCAHLRMLINTCGDIIDKAYSAQDDQATIAEAEKAIYDIRQGNRAGEITNLSDSIYEVMMRFDSAHRNKGELMGITTGIKGLDRVTRGFQKGTLVILAALTGVGKSSLALNMAEHAALKGKKVAIFSLEMPKAEIAQRIMCSYAGVSMSNALSGNLTEYDWVKINDASDVISNLDIFVDDSSLTTPAELLSKCRRIKNKTGLDLVIVDYLQLMSMGTDKVQENRQKEISEISRNLKIMAKELEVPIIALSQLSREAAKRNVKESKEPVLSDLRESGAIEQDADIVMFIHKPYDEENDTTEPVVDVTLNIAKHRNGSTEKIPLKWLGQIVRFVNNDEEGQKLLKNMGKPKQVEDFDAPLPEQAPIPTDDYAMPEQPLNIDIESGNMDKGELEF